MNITHSTSSTVPNKKNAFNLLSPLRKWVITNKYFIKTSEPKEVKSTATHFLLDGGLWKIPKIEYSQFLKLLATDLQNGEYYYISENRSEIFRFICDLDFFELDGKTIGTNQIEKVVGIINSVVSEYYPNNTVIICGTDSKQKNEYIKSGFHLIWPKIWITVQKAIELRLKIITKLLEEYGERDSHNKWEDVVDLAIYKDNGLRMVGCRKIAKCKCGNSGNSECGYCNGTGKVDEGRVYRPISVLGNVQDKKEYLHKLQIDYYLLLLDTSIYNYTGIEESVIIKPLPLSIPVKKNNSKLKGTITENTKIENLIRRTFKQNYSKVNVLKVTKNDSFKYFVEVDSNFCTNVNRNHTSSGIYFQITKTGICQRCFCKKDTTFDRLSGPCRNYSSKEFPLTKQLDGILFKKDLTNFNVCNNTDNKNSTLLNCKNILSKLENELFKML